VTARYDGIIVHSLHPSNISAEEGVRRGAVGAATKRETPAFCGDRGLSAEWGERGIGGWGHAHPARDFSTQRRQYSSCLRISFFECCVPRRRDAAKHF